MPFSFSHLPLALQSSHFVGGELAGRVSERKSDQDVAFWRQPEAAPLEDAKLVACFRGSRGDVKLGLEQDEKESWKARSLRAKYELDSAGTLNQCHFGTRNTPSSHLGASILQLARSAARSSNRKEFGIVRVCCKNSLSLPNSPLLFVYILSLSLSLLRGLASSASRFAAFSRSAHFLAFIFSSALCLQSATNEPSH